MCVSPREGPEGILDIAEYIVCRVVFVLFLFWGPKFFRQKCNFFGEKPMSLTFLLCVGFVSLFHNERGVVLLLMMRTSCILNPPSFCLSLLHSFSRVSLLSSNFFHFKSL